MGASLNIIIHDYGNTTFNSKRVTLTWFKNSNDFFIIYTNVWS